MANPEPEPEGLHRSLKPVLWVTLFVVAVTPFLSTGVLQRSVSSILVAGMAIMALRRSNARRSLVIGGQLAVAAAILVAIVAREVGTDEDWMSTLALSLICVLLLVTPIVVVLRLGARPRITVDTVAGALAAYLQIGVFFSALYQLVQQLSDDPFFSQAGVASSMDFQFFSFVTLTTLGYGDLTPAPEIGQMLAILEAVIGQVFLVTVLGLAVGRLGTAMPRRGGGAEPQQAPR